MSKVAYEFGTFFYETYDAKTMVVKTSAGFGQRRTIVGQEKSFPTSSR